MGDGTTPFEALTGRSLVESTQDAPRVKAVVTIKIFVFDTNCGLLDIRGKIRDFDRSTTLIVVDLVEKIAVTVEDLSANRVASWAGEAGRRGEVAEPVKESRNNRKGSDEKDGTSEAVTPERAAEMMEELLTFGKDGSEFVTEHKSIIP